MALESPEIQVDGLTSVGAGSGGAILVLDLAELIEENKFYKKSGALLAAEVVIREEEQCNFPRLPLLFSLP